MKKVKVVLSTFAFLFALSAVFATDKSSVSSEKELFPRVWVGYCDNFSPFTCQDLSFKKLYEIESSFLRQALGDYILL